MVIALSCSACGRCCDSPPALSSTEAFRFREVLLAALLVRRLEAAQGDEPTTRLRDRLMFRVPSRPGSVAHVAVGLCGYFYDDHSCPALAEGGRCSLHAAGKPSMCCAVPLDPFLPDTAQAGLLVGRAAVSPFAAAGCIALSPAGAPSGGLPASADRAALLRFRRRAAWDRSAWGEAVWSMLRGSLDFRNGAVVMLPPLPVVQILAARSRELRAGARAFVAAQQRLIDSYVAGALRRRRAEERAMTHRLRAWARLYADLMPTLEA